MGWFYLATVLRKSGHNRQAADHFRVLQELLDQPTPLMQEFLDKHSDFPVIVRYNYAVCLSKLDDWGMHGESKKILEELIVQVQAPAPAQVHPPAQAPAPPQAKAQAKPPGNPGLEMLFRSALASALNFELEPENRRPANDPERERADRAEVVEQIEQQCEHIAKLGAKSADDIRRAYAAARAVVKNAYGWALYRQARPKKADDELREAITIMPDFVDAYLNRADILFATKGKLDPNWIEQARDLLSQALLLSPSSERAHYLFGRLFVYPAISDFEKAKEHFAKAELIPWSYLFLAQILKNQEDKIRDAIQTLAKSISRFPRADYRQVQYVKWIIEFVEEKLAEPEPTPADLEASRTLLDNATAAARRLANHGIEDRFKTQGQAFLPQLEKLLEGIPASVSGNDDDNPSTASPAAAAAS
jgi:tetratricopeptide (TPR) repeat protein